MLRRVRVLRRLGWVLLLGTLLGWAPAALQAQSALPNLKGSRWLVAPPTLQATPAPLVQAPALSVASPLQLTPGCDTRTVMTACDGWTGQDKFKHVAFSFTITASTYFLVKNATNLSRRKALWVSLGTTTVIGLTKEWLDWENPDKRCFSAGDMLANGAGMFAASLFILRF